MLLKILRFTLLFCDDDQWSSIVFADSWNVAFDHRIVVEKTDIVYYQKSAHFRKASLHRRTVPLFISLSFINTYRKCRFDIWTNWFLLLLSLLTFCCIFSSIIFEPKRKDLDNTTPSCAMLTPDSSLFNSSPLQMDYKIRGVISAF